MMKEENTDEMKGMNKVLIPVATKYFAQATQENQAEKSAIPIFKNNWCDQMSYIPKVQKIWQPRRSFKGSM